MGICTYNIQLQKDTVIVLYSIGNTHCCHFLCPRLEPNWALLKVVLRLKSLTSTRNPSYNLNIEARGVQGIRVAHVQAHHRRSAGRIVV